MVTSIPPLCGGTKLIQNSNLRQDRCRRYVFISFTLTTPKLNN